MLKRVQRPDAIAGKVVERRVDVAPARFPTPAAIKDQNGDTDRRQASGQLLVEPVVAGRFLGAPEDHDRGEPIAVLRAGTACQRS